MKTRLLLTLILFVVWLFGSSAASGSSLLIQP